MKINEHAMEIGENRLKNDKANEIRLNLMEIDANRLNIVDTRCNMYIWVAFHAFSRLAQFLFGSLGVGLFRHGQLPVAGPILGSIRH